MTTTTNKIDLSKKITLATVKRFLARNKGLVYINVKSRFDGMTDGCESQHEGFVLAKEDTKHTQHSLGIEGAWFVGDSRDYFQKYDNIGGNMEGIQVSNCCGRFILAIKS